ncbi:hypothetical protein SDC9_132344 [bioreactor metagenome]|uniref:Uncharacterized protein n=1 Tax=bioreactor metagenome TaxID=1076179 RepID=A0A645D7C5_9ZZZZ
MAGCEEDISGLRVDRWQRPDQVVCREYGFHRASVRIEAIDEAVVVWHEQRSVR